MEKQLSKKFWASLIIFSLIGQVAWVVENMYFNVFIYQEFYATSTDIAYMVSLSAITATITTLLMGALSDKIGKRKAFICGGYILWGLSILAFSFLKMEILTDFMDEAAAISLGITLVIILDCVMTFFGSTANDACFNAWITDSTVASSRGKVEGINSAMPLIAILVVFGSFMGLTANKEWSIIFLIIGIVVIITGIIGIFIIKENELPKNEENYFKNIFYGFRINVVRKNVTLYLVLLAYSIFGIAIQVFMPYLILYYQYGLNMENYVFVMAPAIILAAVFTAFYGKYIDNNGFKKSVVVSLIILAIGLLTLFIFKNVVMVFIGSLLMMMGYLSGGASFAATVRDYTPAKEVGLFQGIRMVAYVLVPMLIGPWIGSSVIKGGDLVLGDDGRYSEVPNSYIFLASLLVLLLIFLVLFFISKKIGNGTQDLESKYYNDVTDNPLPEYPRPQLVRDSYLNLNGYWDFALSKTPDIPSCFDHKILVPFCVESLLSKVHTNIGKDDYIIYRKTIQFEQNFLKEKTILHFDAIDRICTIYFNNHKLIDQQYVGYFPIELDITNYIDKENDIVVIVQDDNSSTYPYGKQSDKSHGMWYTKVSGIWQTVWIESVNKGYIENIKITPDVDNKKVTVEIDSTSEEFDLEITFCNKTLSKLTTKNKKIEIAIDELHLWSPDDPNLYDLIIKTNDDQISSYFAMRKVDIKNINGVNRLCLNNKPYYFNGLLDQGYYSDGLFTPPTIQAFIDDITIMKKMGFNTLRKHIKVEPRIWYYLCDKLGMIVWQDFINTGRYSFIKDTVLPTIGFKKLNDTNLNMGKNRKTFIDAMKKTINLVYNNPSVCLYTIFNEGWGQFDTKNVYQQLKELDSTRLIDCNSGWFDNNIGDINSMHIYFKPVKYKKDNRATVISEFGGYSYKIAKHSYNLFNTYGYKFYKNQKEFEEAFTKLYLEEIKEKVSIDLCATIYTQVSDVEEETNGILTYDRKVCKLNIDNIKNLMDSIKI